MGKVFGILAGSGVNNQENLFLEQLLKLDVIVFRDNDSFYNNYARNPFNVVVQILWPCMWIVRKSQQNHCNLILRMAAV